MAKNIEMSPEDKMMKAIFKDKYKTEAEIEAEIEEAVNSVSDEEFEKMWGCTPKEHTDKMMLWTGWCDFVINWQRKHGSERKYHVFDNENTFTTKQVVDIVQMAYRQGVEDSKNGTSEYDRLWIFNKLNNADG